MRYARFLCSATISNLFDSSDSKIVKLGTRLVEPNQSSIGRHLEDNEDDDDDAIFAELEAEIENDENSAMRERGLEAVRREYGGRSTWFSWFYANVILQDGQGEKYAR
jgi:hypothetical protein